MLSFICFGQGEFAEGERAYKSAIRTAAIPKAVYYSNLGVLYHRFVMTNSEQYQRISVTIAGGGKWIWPYNLTKRR